jgi:hypothetical protein
MSMDFYSEAGAGVSAEQMDPMATAAAAQQIGTGTTGEPVIGKLKGKPGGKTAKEPMSTTKKVAFGFGGIVLVSAILASFGGGQPAGPKIGHHQAPPGADPAAAAAAASGAGMMGAPGDVATVMSGGAEVHEAQTPTSAAAPANSPAAKVVQATPPAAIQAAAPSTGGAPAPVSAEPVAARPVAGPTGQVAAKASSAEAAKPNADKAVQTAAAVQENAKLTERVADLERKLEKLERTKVSHATSATHITKADDEHAAAPFKVQRISSATRIAASKFVSKAATKPAGTPVQQAQAGAGSAVAATGVDNVHVLGTTVRQGVMTALISVGNTNHRVTEGQIVPGLGMVTKIGADAAGNAFADINGVKYQ